MVRRERPIWWWSSPAAGVDVIGHIDTGYRTRSLSRVEAEITHCEEWYGADGIYVDQAATDRQAEASYYAPLYDFIHSQSGLDLAVLNSGAGPPRACHMGAADSVMTFKGTPAVLAAGAGTMSW